MITGIAMQVSQAIPTTPIELVTHATRVTQFVLVVLVVLSLISWGLMLAKWWELRGAARASLAFENEFTRATRLDQVRTLAKRSPPSPFTRVFGRAAEFLHDLRAGASRAGEGGAATTVSERLSGSQVEALRLLLDSESAAERDRLSRGVPVLAMIGSVSPLIGLLGTVLGVIDAFIGIATKGSGNIGAIAPGVAEALIATAAALAVAIPAVFGYNLFANRVNRIDGELEAFGTEIIAMMVREGQI
ncbi:MAG TPA: MotA/TolQ/ExbB proton channel family protein [Gemmatimonadaceae bacterium]|nr:MotA/TolQ/ExbB proton channel family protein [Gemmatimonadaceae bacterium]